VAALVRTLLFVLFLGGIGQAPEQDPFPTLAELEALIEYAPDLVALSLQARQAQERAGRLNWVSLHGAYSQHFTSYTPLFADPVRSASGDTANLGVSVSVSLGQLLGRRREEALERGLRLLEAERLRQQKLAALRIFYAERCKLKGRLELLQLEARTADLQLERVRIGLRVGNLGFDPIDLAQAQERVGRIEQERLSARIDISILETRIWEVLGKARPAP
jgi:hypothetical protein